MMHATASPWRRPLRYLTFLGTCFSAVCFLAYFLSVLTHSAPLPGCLLSVTALLVILLPPCFAKTARRHFPALLYRILRICYAAGVLFFTVTFLIFSVLILSYRADPPQNSGKTAVLVYGCRVDGDRPGEMLQSRLDAAYTLLAENPRAIAIVSGGLDTGELIPEGFVMADYLRNCGIAPGRILIDGEAESTKGNIRAFLHLQRKFGLDEYHAVSVSSEFHIPRIAYLCSRYGLDCDFLAAETPGFGMLFPSMVREYMAYVKMLLLNDYT